MKKTIIAESLPPQDRLNAVRSSIAEIVREKMDLESQTQSRRELRDSIEASAARRHREASEALARELQYMARGHGQLTDAELDQIALRVLGADLVKAMFLSQLESIPEGLDRPQRLARIDELEKQYDEAGLLEERIISEMEIANLPAVRRRDADPRHILAIQ